MIRIGLLSDTHGYFDPRIAKYFNECDEIWHAGDFGDGVAEKLLLLKPLRGVFGNIDGTNIRKSFSENLIFFCEGLKVYITHIGGYPGNYFPRALQKIESDKPGLFISGHSHILRVMPDKKYNLLHMNPGAAGKHGFHKMKTMIRFNIDKGKVKDPEVIELGLRGSIDELS